MAIDKIIDPGLAASAYKNTLGVGAKAAGGDEGSVTFADFLKQKVSDSISVLKAGETKSAQAVKGEADLNDVVQAVNAAELTLQTVVAVRDRLVGAYQDIMRMPV